MLLPRWRTTKLKTHSGREANITGITTEITTSASGKFLYLTIPVDEAACNASPHVDW